MKGKIAIDRERCKGCTYCIDACPAGVIVISKKFNSSGFFPAEAAKPERCTGCTLCARICPEIAIEVFLIEDRRTAASARKGSG